MATVTYLGDDSNQASVTWCNPTTKEEFVFPIRVPVELDSSPLAKHIIDKLTKVPAMSAYFKLELDGRTKEAKALKAG